MSACETNEQIEARILAENGVAMIGENIYSVVGKPYTIRWVGRGDDDFVHLWECDCPASKFHPDKMCKHIRQVADACHSIADEMGCD